MRVFVACSLLLTLAASESRLEYPPAPRSDVVERLHGVEIRDPYRWLEDLQSAETRRWVGDQKRLTEDFSRGLAVEPIRRRIAELQDFRRLWPPIERGGRMFFVETPSATGGTAIGGVSVFMEDGKKGRQLILSSKALFPNGDYELQRFIAPSPDGRRLAFSFSRPSSRWLRWRIFDVEIGKPLAETLTGSHTTVATVAWRGDSSSFVYARFDEPKEGEEQKASVRNARLYLHRLGRSQSGDRLVHGEGAEADRWFLPYVAEDDTLIVVSGRGTENENDVIRIDLDQSGRSKTLNESARGSFTYLGSRNSALYFLTNWEAERSRIVRFEAGRWQEAVAQSDDAIAHASLAGDHFVIASIKDAAPVYRLVSIDGRKSRTLPLPAGNVWGPPWGPGFVGDRSAKRAYFILSGLADAGTVYALEPATARVKVWQRPALSLDPDRFETRHVLYPSTGGTKVPMFLVHRKGLKPDGTSPVIMYGYGALSWSVYPWFQPQMVVWLERGGIFALPGTRGGGEYGESWHRAGSARNRQNAIDDYIAAAQWLVDHRYSSAGKIVASGSSLGAALPAAATAQRPDLFGAALIDIPVLDLIGYERHTGALMWKSELGSASDAEDFRVLYAYSPVHNVHRTGTCARPTLVTAGSRDETAVPSHAFKYVAALQHAQSCSAPVLLQLVEGAGHSYGTTPQQTATTWAMQLAFAEKALAMSQIGKPK